MDIPVDHTTLAVSDNKASSKVKKKKQHSCFVISPFGGYYDRYFEEVYEPAVAAAGLHARRADDLYRPSAIINDIWSYVREAKLLLADLTGKNPNVFYELGLAHACSKPVVLLTQTIDDVPFDLRSLRIISYNLADPAWSSILRVAITRAIQEVLASPLQSVLPTFHVNGKTPDKKPETVERRLAAMELRLARITAESNSLLGRRGGQDEVRGPSEALMMIKDLRAQGLSDVTIIDILSSRGVPIDWLQEHLRRAPRKPKSVASSVTPKKRKKKAR